MSAAQRTAQDIQTDFPGVHAISHHIDVTSEESIDKAVSEAVSQLGRIDYAVNCAGIGGLNHLSAEHDVEAWTKTMNVDLTGVWMSSRREIQTMLQQEKMEE